MKGLEDRLAKLKEELCSILLKTKALKFGSFILTSGGLSPYYIDLRLIPSHPSAFRKVIGFYVDLIENEIGIDKFDRIAGIPTAGMPFSSALAFKLGKPFLYVRREVKRHGRERKIEGELMLGDKVLIVDDLVTTGKTVADAVEALRGEGAIVERAVVLIDREEGAEDLLSKLEVKLCYLAKIREIAKILYDLNAIDEAQLNAILKQVRVR